MGSYLSFLLVHRYWMDGFSKATQKQKRYFTKSLGLLARAQQQLQC
ncbi:hypothetical protein JAB1_31870 [Janthinobacterium sp. MP5059B]|nr:hypothetical protein JAB1_31870 [Janthinobacterium sp. MP5059B]